MHGFYFSGTSHEFQHAWLLFFWNVTRRQTVSFLWSRQHNTANLRKNAVALPNQPRQTSNEKYCCKWKRFGRSLRKTLRHEQLRAKLVDLVLQTLTTIRIGLVSLCQSQPCVRHLQENSTLLFILSGLCYFQRLCGEATVLVRLTHRNDPPIFGDIFCTVTAPRFLTDVLQRGKTTGSSLNLNRTHRWPYT